jgi:hypothetical protein
MSIAGRIVWRLITARPTVDKASQRRAANVAS